jgi:uncharacterized protein (UPF0254 family)
MKIRYLMDIVAVAALLVPTVVQAQSDLVQPVPEPSSFLLLSAAAVGVGWWIRRHRQ